MQVRSYDFVLCCSVKPAIFDLFLAVAIVGYLAVVYLAVQVCIWSTSKWLDAITAD